MAIGGQRIIPGNTGGGGGIPPGMQAFAASVQIWNYELDYPGAVWFPTGIAPITIWHTQEARRFDLFGVVTLSRGTQWGAVTVTLTTTGAGAFGLGPQPSVIIIQPNQSQVYFDCLVTLNRVGESVLQVDVYDGTYLITQMFTLIVTAGVVSGGYYGGRGLGEELL